MTTTYDANFLAYSTVSSRYAAGIVVSLLRNALAPASVLDVGCAEGGWLSVWRRQGVPEVFGIDGHYVARERLMIPEPSFTAADLAQPFNLGRTFDLVQSLEVAEHLPRETSAAFIDSLCGHARHYVVFSAAPPGQGGAHHINEQTYDFWRELITRHGFTAFDYVRPRILNDAAISYWYRYNLVLYVRNEWVPRLPGDVAATRIADGAPIPDLAPAWFRLRKRAVRLLPVAAQDGMARLKSRYFPSGRV